MIIINLNDKNNSELENNIKKYFDENRVDTKNVRVYLIDDIENLSRITSVKSKKNILITSNITTDFILNAIGKTKYLVYAGMNSEDIITKIEGYL